ncbi:efflux RND transporter periplasmic adaptor subunit [Aureimonas leprariae]|uniref:Efflux RND transporter periplasmic adaptor subunit n=1 Tax=Plantimonas leprariae TaxID=2615207 RepID=A0A7V7PPK0_9HYPH|nr:efflux RND transporter periplasmic adaptor subunit [Aureimonas leprariae]KAB0679877.1 efflux RND transporter periplasmic adaptor subunit [Aureimonas leprariae]
MAFLKQIVVTLAVVVGGMVVWMMLDPRPGQFILGALPDDQAALRRAVAAISAKPETGEKAGATPVERGRNQRPTIVFAGTVGEADTRTQMRAIATGEAEHSVVVYPDTTGIIATVPLKSGDAVASGAPLAILQKDTEELAVDRARIALDAADEKLLRYQRLAESRAVSSVEANDAVRERDNARLDLRAAEVALAKRTIVAPLGGRVGIVNVEPGDLVSNQNAITTVDDRTRLRAIFYAPEAFVQDLKVGQPVEAVATARPENLYRGTISAIDSRLDETSRTLRTEALLDNAADELRPGMSFVITLKLPGERLLAVDPLAVQWERDGAFVWKIVDNKVEKAPVRVVERSIDRIILTSTAVKLNDRVVVEGVQSVREGGSVEVRGEPRPPAGPANEDDGPSAEASPTRAAEAAAGR